jgi:hypothetical protein
MGGGAFNWLKTGWIGAESVKQAEIHLADLWKILSTVRRRRARRCGLARQRPFIVDLWLKRTVSVDFRLNG